MFIQVNPDAESYSETLGTLKFAERVSGVELGAARSNKEGKDVKDLMEQVSYLLFYFLSDILFIITCSNSKILRCGLHNDLPRNYILKPLNWQAKHDQIHKWMHFTNKM